MRIRPTAKRELTDEQKKILRERLKVMRDKNAGGSESLYAMQDDDANLDVYDAEV